MADGIARTVAHFRERQSAATTPGMIPRFFVLAAGVGSRLRPLTDECPKALVEIGGAPLLDRWFHRIEAVANGCAEIRINAHHLPEQIVARTNVYRTRSSSSWSVCREDSLLGTAGTLFRHLDWIDSSNGSPGSIVIYADNSRVSTWGVFGPLTWMATPT